MIGGGAIASDEALPGLLMLAGGIATLFSAVPTWPQTKLHFGILGNRWPIVGLAVAGIVLFIVGASLTSE